MAGLATEWYFLYNPEAFFDSPTHRDKIKQTFFIDKVVLYDTAPQLAITAVHKLTNNSPFLSLAALITLVYVLLEWLSYDAVTIPH